MTASPATTTARPPVRNDPAPDERRYRSMRFIRRFEETLLELFERGLLNGTTHACIGQEADAVGVLEHVEPGDHVFSNHRCHGHYLAHTGDGLGLLAEIMGKQAGVCSGIGGSQHLCAPGFLSNGVQGGIVPAAAGIALARSLDGSDRISAVFVGDGTMGEGVVYETLNMAALWRLPLLVVVEDNGWAQSTPRAANTAGRLADRFRAFDIEVTELDTTDVVTVSAAAGRAVAEIRGGGGPRALVISTYRLCHHSKNDDARPADEVAARWPIEPLAVHGRRLADARRAELDDDVEREIAELVEHALALP